MERRSLTYWAGACDGEIAGAAGAALVRRLTTNSREVEAGDLFVALVGERFDGHTYVAEAARRGAVASVVNRRWVPPESAAGLGWIRVEDTRCALGRMAACYRGGFRLPVVAIGGSNGKTTTKELVASVLGRRHAILASPASFNNDVGVPLTLLELTLAHRAAVLEVGTNHPGELAPLVRMVAPDVGVITSIGREHLEFFGSVDAVVEEQGWLAELLPSGGCLCVPGDGRWAELLARRTRARVLRIGAGEVNEWRLERVSVDAAGVDFSVRAPSAAWSGEYRVNLLGRHQALNALFALAVGAEFGLGREELRQGLADCRPPALRMQVWEAGGVRVIEDCYNANADSMAAALAALGELPCLGRRIAVLGDMAELGPHAAEAHAEAGGKAAAVGVDVLVAVGRMAAVTASAARDRGLSEVSEHAGFESAAAEVRRRVRAGDVVLLKASRVARLERLGAALREAAGPAV
jgi:UDP-N-acetylmuramoyl-tripeptide--D-alanyl-D-alanine ligase